MQATVVGGDGMVVVGGMVVGGDVVGTGAVVGGGGGGGGGCVVGGAVRGGDGAAGVPRGTEAPPPAPGPDPDVDRCVLVADPAMVVVPFGAVVVTCGGTVVDGRASIPDVTGAPDVEPGLPAFAAVPTPPHAVARSTTTPRIQGIRRAIECRLRFVSVWLDTAPGSKVFTAAPSDANFRPG
ncbi:MAG TPA: hypothetical protein VII96_04640 [Acidimicrobiales bacterium]